jgi:hypothetical protein
MSTLQKCARDDTLVVFGSSFYLDEGWTAVEMIEESNEEVVD